MFVSHCVAVFTNVCVCEYKDVVYWRGASENLLSRIGPLPLFLPFLLTVFHTVKRTETMFLLHREQEQLGS